MRSLARSDVSLLALCLLAPPAFAFQVTLDSGAGSLTIVDNDANDLNPGTGEIDFSQTVGGIFLADGRAVQSSSAIDRQLQLGTRTPGSDAIFRNLDGAAAHTFSVTIDSDAITPPGPPLGWSIFSEGLADDTAAGDVEFLTNDVTLTVNSGSDVLGTLSVPITPPVLPADQPVDFDEVLRGVSPSGDAMQMRLTWTLAAGANDQIRLPDPNADADSKINVSVFNAADKCAVKMNKRAGNVAKKGGIDDAKCVKSAADAGGDATACVDDPASPKMAKAEDQLLADFVTFCSVPPPFATNDGTCCDGGANAGDPCTGAIDCPGGACTAGACINAAAGDAAAALTHDLFGATVGVGSDATGVCQFKVLKAAVNVHDIRWRSLAKCKQKNFPSFTTEADFVTTCLGPPQPEFTNISGREATLAKRIDKVCLGKGVTGLSTVFPGACAGTADPDFASCLDRRIACRFCLGAVVADDVMTPLDCDVLDDGTANGSCP
jgi:hypothetical protein